ncbi:hypothetical protein GCM10011581_07250 [Saccharopolyspora subtropica]|uniref:Thiamine-binding protein domain-containing protein n=1 Tax=Saccharopolyspora thermophila TaxID=89367 RepID=A0A917JJM3_9PSEU|nr:thiamine-binding protein [Saccharopolyspora subtropica]GGI72825.1 hypothetical protein GCM10011581_07250 [Saccharopolyspora subtropica]
MLVAFSVAPSGAGDSVSEAVAAAVKVVRESGLPHAPRTSLVLKADIRPGYTNQLQEKVRRVEEHLSRE